MDTHGLPPQMHVFVRDWLSANNIVLRSRDGHTLIDSGYGKYSALTLALLASPRGIGDDPLGELVNTHCHSDHFGGNAAVSARYGCPIALPEDEVPVVERWDTAALLLDVADQHAERFHVDRAIVTGTVETWGDLEWQVLAAPGHAMRAVVFYNPEHRILISGDTLWENGFGFVMPAAMDPDALPATRDTLEMIAGLELRAVIPGHGDVITEPGRALDRAFKRVAAFEADPSRVARHALKALLTFNLLDRRTMPVADLPAFMANTAFYREVNALCFGLSPQGLADLLVQELVKVGAVQIQDGNLTPAA
jgi:glyoxylase-like metal-dependent hydrolase (beta-lactamase superfamily II)